jgi:small nuclear ribonucleoprotein (snRNP)-like protein
MILKMTFERNDCYMKLRNLYDECKRCLYFHVILTMADGTTFDGIIEDVDMDNITVLAGEEVIEGENENQPSEQRQYYGYGRPRRKFRRFRRRKFRDSRWICVKTNLPTVFFV